MATGPNTHGSRSGTAESILLARVGVATVALGTALHERTQRDYTTRLYALGLAGLVYGLGVTAFDSDAQGWGAGFLAISVLVLLLSIPLQQRLFALAGTGSAYTYFSRLVFDVFEGSAVTALTLAALGLLIVARGMPYQRFSQQHRGRMDTR